MKSIKLILTLISTALSTAIIAQCNLNFELGNDTTLDCGTSVTLTAPTGLDGYNWMNLSNTNTLNVSQGGTYWCTAYQSTGNLVTNGDFSNGSSGFQSDYTPGTGGSWGLLSNEGEYAVTSNSSLVHNNFPNCTDHTSGNPSGSMLVVNGSSTAGLNVWEQTINVTPNTDYTFNTWGMTVTASNPAQLNFSINGSQIGSIFNLPSSTCNWQQFAVTWNSGTNTTATIAIVNQNTSPSGNDFALDDILFSQICEYSDTITVSYPNAPTLTVFENDTICAGETAQLSSTTDIAGSTVTWYPGAITGANITVSPTTTTTYSAVATSPQNCNSATESVTITVGSDPVITASPDITICENDSAEISFTSDQPLDNFQWSPINSNNDTVVVYPQDTTTYIISGTNQWGCHDTDSVTVSVTPTPQVNLTEDQIVVCTNDSVQLEVEYNTAFSTNFYWQNVTNSSEKITFSAFQDSVIAVRIEQNNCFSAWDTSYITTQDHPTLTPLEDQIICPEDNFYLETFADIQQANITWLPSQITGNSYSASSDSAHIVGVFAQIGNCISDTIYAQIAISNECDCYWFLPNIFTPNGDNLNDYFEFIDANNSCGFIDFNLTVYNRWGETMWQSDNAAKKWDGTRNGNEPQEGTYFWRLEYTDQFNQKASKSGNVTLLK